MISLPRKPIRTHDRRIQNRTFSRAEQTSGSTSLRSPGNTCLDNETRNSLNFSVEVSGIEPNPPYRFIHLLQFGYRECASAESRGQSCALKFLPGAFDTIDNDVVMIESQFDPTAQHIVHGHPTGTHGIRTSRWFRQTRRDRQISYGHDAATWITSRFAVGSDLLEMQLRRVQSGFLTKFTMRGFFQTLVGVVEETAGKRSSTAVRLDPTFNE